MDTKQQLVGLLHSLDYRHTGGTSNTNNTDSDALECERYNVYKQKADKMGIVRASVSVLHRASDATKAKLKKMSVTELMNYDEPGVDGRVYNICELMVRHKDLFTMADVWPALSTSSSSPHAEVVRELPFKTGIKKKEEAERCWARAKTLYGDTHHVLSFHYNISANYMAMAYGYSTIAWMFQCIQDTPAARRNYYEHIDPARKCRPYFDLELNKSIQPEWSSDKEEAMFDAFTHLLFKWFKMTHAIELTHEMITVADSSDATKWSRHVHIDNAGVYYTTSHTEHNTDVENMIHWLKTTMKDDPNTRLLIVKKEKKVKSVIQIEDSFVVDTSVYGKGRCFRLMWNSKLSESGKGRIRPLRMWQHHGDLIHGSKMNDIRLDWLQDTLIQYFPVLPDNKQWTPLRVVCSSSSSSINNPKTFSKEEISSVLNMDSNNENKKRWTPYSESNANIVRVKQEFNPCHELDVDDMDCETLDEQEIDKYVRILNPLNIPSIQMVVGTAVNVTLTEYSSTMALPLTLFKSNTKTLALVHVYKNKERQRTIDIWGFVSLGFLSYRRENSLVRDGCVFIDKRMTFAYIKDAVYVPDTSADPSYRFFHLTNSLCNNEMNMDSYSRCLSSRVMLYKRVLAYSESVAVECDYKKVRDKQGTTVKATWVDKLETERDVKYNNFSFYGVMIAVASAALPRGEPRSDLVDMWKSLEIKLAKARLDNYDADTLYAHITPIVDVKQIKLSEMTDTVLKQRLMEWNPIATTFYSCPFEKALTFVRKRDTCLMIQGRVFLTILDLKAVALSHFINIMMKEMDLLLDQTRMFDYKLPHNIRRITNKVGNAVRILKDGLVHTHTQLHNPTRVPIEVIRKYAPACIKVLEARATQIMHPYLADRQRWMYGQYLRLMGWDIEAIKKHWRPKLAVLYEPKSERDDEHKDLKKPSKPTLEAAMREVNGTMLYLQTKRQNTIYKCRKMIELECCPRAKSFKDGMAAERQCCNEMTRKLEGSGSQVRAIESPFAYTMTLIEALNPTMKTNTVQDSAKRMKIKEEEEEEEEETDVLDIEDLVVA